MPQPLAHSLHPAALWCVLLIPLAASISRFAADLLLILAALAFALHCALARRTDWLAVRWFQVALLIWAYVMLRALFAEDVAGSLGRAASWLRFPLFALALQLWILQNAAHSRKLLYGLSGAVAFMLLDTALQYFVGYDILLREPIPEESGGYRLTGPYSAPRIGIMLIWMAIPCMAYWLMREGGGSRSGKPLLLGAFFAVGTITVIFMSGERMALLLSGLAFVLAFFMLPVSKKLMLALAALGALLMALLAYSNPALVGRQMHSTEKVVGEFSGSLYGQIWQSGVAMAKDNPLFGVGLRQFRVRCPEPAFGATDAKTVSERCNQHPHNTYLEWLVEAGAVGLGLFLLMIFMILRHVLSAYAHLKTNPLFLGLLITALIRLWPLASTTSFFTAWSAVPFWLMLGWLLAEMQRSKEA